MPALTTVESFVALVESGRGIEALERFYADHATMRVRRGFRRCRSLVICPRAQMAPMSRAEGAVFFSPFATFSRS